MSDEKQDKVVEELDAIAPDRSVAVGGEPLIVKERSYLQALQFGSKARPLIDALAKVMAQDEVDDKAFLDAIEDHHEIFLEMLCLCTGKLPVDFDGVGGTEGECITAAVYEANQDFFSRRISRAIRRDFQPSRPANTMPPCSSTDTEKLISTDTPDDK